jgi:hypothetical protein
MKLIGKAIGKNLTIETHKNASKDYPNSNGYKLHPQTITTS